MQTVAFRPCPGGTVSRTVSTTSANVARPAAARGANAVRVAFTAGTAGARIRFGKGSTIAATSADMMCPNPGTPFVYAETFTIDALDDYIAAITDSGTCTMEFTFGYGI
jgi:hypothetical protein